MQNRIRSHKIVDMSKLVPVQFDHSDDHYGVAVRLCNLTYPDYPDTIEDWKRGDKNRQPQYLHKHHLFADAAGELVAYGSWGHTYWSHHPQRFYLDIFIDQTRHDVEVEDWIYQFLLKQIEPHDPISIESEARENNERRVRFLTERGFKLKTTEYTSKLDLTRFDADQYAPLLEKVAERGIVFKSVAQLREEDDDFFRKYYDASIEIHKDVPWHEESTYDPFDLWLKKYHDGDFKRIHEATLIALDKGAYIGMTMLFRTDRENSQLQTGLTGVMRDYRRMGIATALKAASLGWAKTHVRKADGSIPDVMTENEANNPMYQINEALGFVKQPSFLFFTKAFDRPETQA